MRNCAGNLANKKMLFQISSGISDGGCKELHRMTKLEMALFEIANYNFKISNRRYRLITDRDKRKIKRWNYENGNGFAKMDIPKKTVQRFMVAPGI